MKKTFYIFLLFIIHCLPAIFLEGSLFIAYAQPVSQEWVARYILNPGGGEAQGPFYALDKSGNSFVAGPNFINDTNNVVVIKYNNSGVQQWATSYKYPGYAYFYPVALALDSSGNPVIAATYGVDPFPPQNFVTVKFNRASGSVIWAKTYNGVNVGAGQLYMNTDRQNNIYLVSALGGTGTTICIKYNENGDTLWTRTWHPQGSGRVPYGCIIDDSSNIIITGIAYTVLNGFTYDSALTMKYSPGGVLRWERTFAYYASFSAQNQGQMVVCDQYGNIYVSGRTSASASNVGFLTIKYDLNGNLQWASRYYQLYDNYVSAITVDRINNFVFVTGENQSTNNHVFAATIKYNALTGDTVWVRKDTGIYANASAFDIKADSSGNSYVTGGTSSAHATYGGIVTMKFSSQGGLIWLISDTLDDGHGQELQLDKFNNVYICGGAIVGIQQSEYIVIKYSQISGLHQISSNIPKAFNLYQNFPNPFNPNTKFKFDIAKSEITKIIIYDIIGREIVTLVNEKLNPGIYEINWNAGNCSSGVYFYRMIAGEKMIDAKKMILIK